MRWVNTDRSIKPASSRNRVLVSDKPSESQGLLDLTGEPQHEARRAFFVHSSIGRTLNPSSFGPPAFGINGNRGFAMRHASLASCQSIGRSNGWYLELIR